MRLPTGAELRTTGPLDGVAVLCVNGGQANEVEGTWSASIEWLVQRLAPRFPHVGFAELRYRIKSWKVLESCIADARAALAALPAGRLLLVGFSMGGAVATSVAHDPRVEAVVGLAPWLPPELSLEPLRGRRLVVIHGSLDRAFPGVPGVAPSHSRAAFERAVGMGIEGEYALLKGAAHGLALRAPWGRPVPLPRAKTWLELTAREVDRFASA